MPGVLRLIIVCFVFVLTACGSSGNRRRTTPPECRIDADCLLSTADGGGVIPACHEAVCEDNTCKLKAVDEGSSCDDKDDKTVRDRCHEEVCAGEPATCNEQAGQCKKAALDPATNTCTLTDLPDGTSCDDGDLCTENDSCASGQCGAGKAITCEAKDDCHLAGTCDPKTGKCDDPKADDGTTCDDALVCTVDDACVDGECKGSDKVCDDGLTCSKDTCDEALGGCQVDVSACACETSATCDDGNACNGVETCNLAKGLCEQGTPKDCTGESDACNVGTCDPASGACAAKPVKNGTACDDGSLCSKTDTCQKGVCAGGGLVTCAAQDQCHSAGTCAPKTGVCSNPAKPDGATCDDALVCTTGDTCKTGACTGAAKVCTDGRACSVDGCSEAALGCTFNTATCGCSKDADCDNGNLCDGVEKCTVATGTCSKGTAVNCAAMTDACNTGVCTPSTGLCTAQAKPNGTTCTDANACTQFDACTAGKCTGKAVVCPTPDQCHNAGACNATTGACTNPVKPTGTTCSDGLSCTTGDACNAAGVCTGPARVCNDGVTCTVDSCSEAAGGCTADRSKCGCQKDADCNDGNACNGVEKCNLTTLTCVTGTAVNCTALTNACNTGTCTPATGACSAVPRPNGATCNDGSLCTTGDVCTAGKCGGAAVVCPAPDQCHNTRTCDPANGTCTNPAKPNGTTCSDGKTCTAADVCTAGVCGGPPLACADTIACTVDSCVEPTGCAHGTAACQCTKSADCNDGNACNGVETCDLATLSCKAGTAVSCTQFDDACNTGTCAPATGDCSAKPKLNGTTCNDGALCTTGDVCTAGRCAGTAVSCPAADQCHNTRACDPANGQCTNVAKPNGAVCDDGLFCTLTDVCTTGVCKGTQISCNDGISCTVDACTEASRVCTFTPTTCQCTTDAQCNDGNACNGVETCDRATFSCKAAGTTVDCSRLNGPCTTGTCTPATGACTATPKTGAACDDGNACTPTDACNAAGQCAGAGTVTCVQPSNPCQVATCVAPGGCQTGNRPDRTVCNDNDTCTSGDACAAGVCRGTARSDKLADWGDDPGAQGAGPLSIDLMPLADGRVGAVGVYTGPIDFAGSTLDYSPNVIQALYLASYLENGTSGNGKSDSQTSIGRILRGAFSVNDIAVHQRDDQFAVVGSLGGIARFGLEGQRDELALPALAAGAPYAAGFERDGSARWAWFGSELQGAVSVDATTVLADGATIVVGTAAGTFTFNNIGSKQTVAVPSGGAWAARIEVDGTIKAAPVRIAAAKSGTLITVKDVTGHADGGYTVIGEYTGAAMLGPRSEQVFTRTQGTQDAPDAWILRLDENSAYVWGGRLGASGADRAGAVVTIDNDAIVVSVDTNGGDPTLDAGVSTALHNVAKGGTDIQLVRFEKDGNPKNASIIGNVNGSAMGFALGFGKDSSVTVGGVFTTVTSVYDEVGFGAGAPGGTPVNLTGAARANTLLAARYEPNLEKRRWGVSVLGTTGNLVSVNSPDWDVVMAVHPSTSVTLGGMFQGDAVPFGVALPKALTSADKAGSPFVTHFDSQNEQDVCK